jgi:diacylglycerol kinase family enzyme
VRALLIVNPHATSTTPLRRDVIVRALSSAVELEVVETRYRGHATSLASAARNNGLGLVLTLGGDGTVNEAVNGILAGGPGHDALLSDSAVNDSAVKDPVVISAPAASLPALAPLPGGNANVFTRAIGLPADPVDAAGQILRALAEGRHRSIGLGLAGDRYFTFNAGLGLDAEVVRAVDGHRARGRSASTALYVRMTMRQYYRVTDRRHPSLTLERAGHPPSEPLFLGIVSNTSPWTYLGRRPVYTNPQAGFDSGLDLFALRSMRPVSIFRTLRQMLSAERPPHGRSVLTLHDQAELTLRSGRPVAFQVDGEYMGEHECVRFLSVPDALRIIA